ncbi:MAG: carbohydrate-binding domain-containing protein [Actinobacteria bacterium]|uniref:Carbohydrate-binding domain-containing protein n=1 Tax=Nostocoides veronense TaxID=330836 RepID=A0ABN2LPL3_9MICO|nr:carbohydrate-binding domain-containing protein [Actinomycetota bacterium]
MKTQRITSALVALTAGLGLAACGGNASGTPAGSVTSAVSGSTGTSSSSSAPASGSVTSAESALLSDNAASHASAQDTTYDAAQAVSVTLADGASTASGTAGVSIKDDLITISTPGTYVLKGTLTDGSVVVNSDTDGTVRLVLDGATITNSVGAAVNIQAADQAVVVLADGTTNALTDGTGYDTSAQDAPNAALFSMADLTIGGSGSLTVTGNTNDGIASKDGLVIQGGTIQVTAVDDGVRGKDYLIVAGGSLDVSAADDGLKSDNESDDTVGYILISGGKTTVTAGDDGVHAEGDLAVTGGTVEVTKSTEALEGANIVIENGSISLTSSDDGLNATAGTSSGGGMGGGGMQDDGSQLLISGGTIVVNAGGDGLDSNGRTTISGGTTVVYGPTMNGNGSLDSNGGTTVTGGTVLAAGSSGMAEAPDSASTGGWVQLGFSSTVSAGQTVSIASGDQVLATFTAVKDYSNLVFTGAGITSGQSYDVWFGGALAADQVATFSLGGSIDGATKVGSVTAGQGTGGMGGH